MDNFDGSSISPLRYRRHEIFRGKVPMPDCLPGIRCKDDSDASTLIVTMGDVGSGLEVDLIYGTNNFLQFLTLENLKFGLLLSFFSFAVGLVVMHHYDAVTRRVVFRNCDTRSKHGYPGILSDL